MDIVLIPAYEPDEQLISLVDELADNNFKIVVVDDGSGEKYTNIFDTIRSKTDIVTLPKNCGKGAALKAGMRYIKENLPECENFITCDADGQHLPSDVIRVQEQLHKGNRFVLTVRQRKGKIPFRSKFGNNLSRFVYTLLTNRYLSDNQSGLRGFSVQHLDWLINVEKNNYDYEMNVLYYAAKMGLKITTLTIDAIYIENNASSHFNPVGDTIKIYRSLFKLARGTLIAFLVAEVLILLASIFFGNKYIEFTVPSTGAIAMITTFLLNKFFFFKNSPRYDYLITFVYSVISYFMYTLICMLFAESFMGIPLFLSFNITYIVCIPLRFFLHQLIFLASITKE